VDISRISSPIPSRLSKSILAKSKFYNKNSSLPSNYVKSYTQVSKENINKIIEIKKAFLKLSPKKVSEVHDIINKAGNKDKPKFNITTKNPSHKQVITLIGMNNVERIVSQAGKHVKNINRLLKSIKSEIVADYIQSDNKDIIVTTNKVAASSDLNTVEKYIKDLNDVDLSNIISLRLPQSKYYLKILGISYFVLWQPLITKTNDHTNGKSLSWISSREFTRELDKEPLLN